MTNIYVAMYRKGAITANHLIAQCLVLVEPEDPSMVLDDFPVDLLGQMTNYICNYESGAMISNYGSLPTAHQVEAAKHWIENVASPRLAEETTQRFHPVIQP